MPFHPPPKFHISQPHTLHPPHNHQSINLIKPVRIYPSSTPQPTTHPSNQIHRSCTLGLFPYTVHEQQQRHTIHPSDQSIIILPSISSSVIYFPIRRTQLSTEPSIREPINPSTHPTIKHSVKAIRQLFNPPINPSPQ